MIRKIYGSILAAIVLVGCGSSTTKTTPPPPVKAITVSSGSSQSATVNTAFAAPLVAKVTTGGTPTSGVVVTFTAPTTGASGTFAGGVNTATTDSNGLATSAVFSANGTAGAYAVTASAAGVSTPATFNLTNTAVTVASNNFSFYLSGYEAANGGDNFYALAGSVAIDADGNVLAGEQDYNDAFGLTSPQPSGDSITGGTLTVDANGQGTLTLITNNADLGVSGTETLGVQFVNTKHALVIQFDGSATSSGSMDMQTLPSTLSGGFSFTFSGVDVDYYSVVGGGVFTVSGTNLQNGVLDVDDEESGTTTLGTAFTGTISAPDSFGRGTITSTDLGIALNYYVVGPEVIRLIEVDVDQTFIGSAFGQGAGSFSNASLGTSVFGVKSNYYSGNVAAAAGMFATNPDQGTYQGVADNDEEGSVVSGSSISGTYTIASNGYGNLTDTSENLQDVSVLGIYMTDPNLNLNDPNNTTSGLGGALVADLDAHVTGTGVLIPQTDTATDSFAGNYAFGAQNYWGCMGVCEFDLVGQGSVTSGVLAGTGLVNDIFSFFNTSTTDSGVTFAATISPDGVNAGRYANLLAVTVSGTETDLTTVTYQASGDQLIWLDEDSGSLSLGSFEQQGSLTGLLATSKVAAKTKPKQ